MKDSTNARSEMSAWRSGTTVACASGSVENDALLGRA